MALCAIWAMRAVSTGMYSASAATPHSSADGGVDQENYEYHRRHEQDGLGERLANGGKAVVRDE